MDPDKAIFAPSKRQSVEDLPTIQISPENCNIVCFGVETAGFEKTSQILKIKALCNEKNFSVYFHPTGPIDSNASHKSGLEIISGKLCLHGEEVQTYSAQDGLKLFRRFLKLSPKPCILVAHNIFFHANYLLRLIVNNNVIKKFKHIAGFCDSIKLLKQRFPERQGEGKFKLSTLAEDFFALILDTDPEGPSDLSVIKELIKRFIKKEAIYENCLSYKQFLVRKFCLSSLSVINGVVSQGIIDKMADAGIDYEILKNGYEEDQRRGIEDLLGGTGNPEMPIVTRSKRVIDSLEEHFQTVLFY